MSYFIFSNINVSSDAFEQFFERSLEFVVILKIETVRLGALANLQGKLRDPNFSGFVILHA